MTAESNGRNQKERRLINKKIMLTFEDETGVYVNDKRPLYKREVNLDALQGELESLKRN